ncbi:MotA/TolQ/ExbB proton channel family protein [Paraliomyxa miuraensis]|uniref:MotA/TolQ/ExbB proton channel family protein n=1 Tax=Paraliomyxa miuraensis TaxID=376150 RepID=UPI00225A8AFD|nr:MotA/TolQ/ExbB proton channel family protein [Paraliomyxa miuraensis]MCX4241249.1 MotA/TolQ/ExbB proton channel family protein [Paraliomyxa miuraensis]
MELSLLEIWESMGFLSRLVAIGLVAMGVASLFVAIERVLVLGKAAAMSNEFAAKARPLLEDRDFEPLLDLAKGKDYERTPLPRLMAFGLESYFSQRKHVINDDDEAVTPAEMARRELTRRQQQLDSELRRGMGILASTGSTAPFIGLFGTVIGIITAFQGIAAAGGGGLEAVSAGIAEALIVTAVGLVVAIGAVLVFNYLTARFDKFEMHMQHASGELVDFLEGAGRGRKPGK